MNVFLEMEGSCPVCGQNVPRTLSGAGERYACPDHGVIGYRGAGVTVSQWTERLADKMYM